MCDQRRRKTCVSSISITQIKYRTLARIFQTNERTNKNVGPRRACRESGRRWRGRDCHLHHHHNYNRTNNLPAAYSRNLCHITAGIDTGGTGTGGDRGRFAPVPAVADAQGQGGTPGQGSASEGNPSVRVPAGFELVLY